MPITTIHPHQIAQSQLIITANTTLNGNDKIQAELRKELLEGLTSDNMYISSKFFYNRHGSELFEWITQLPEYYPTRTEKEIINTYKNELFAHLSHVDLIELGSGDCSKISIALNAIAEDHRDSIIYYPIDFSSSSIKTSKRLLNKAFPGLKIEGRVADFTQLNELPNKQPRIICFFGSTIGNFEPQQTAQLLTRLSKLMHTGDQLILGMDLVKNIHILEAAYNDSQRITEAFNKNILRSCNGILGTNFIASDFEHQAFFNPEKSRIEMHLRALNDLYIKSYYFNGRIIIRKGESIHTENSHKYTEESIHDLAQKSGLSIKNIYHDLNQWFAVVQLCK